VPQPDLDLTAGEGGEELRLGPGRGRLDVAAQRDPGRLGLPGRRAAVRSVRAASIAAARRRSRWGPASMSDIAVLAHLAPVLGMAPSGPAVRRALGLAGGTAMLERIARPARRPGRMCGS